MDVWHDRAVFHFLTDADARVRYREHLLEVLKPGGSAIIATFAPDGPEKCSGLPIAPLSCCARCGAYAGITAIRAIGTHGADSISATGRPPCYSMSGAGIEDVRSSMKACSVLANGEGVLRTPARYRQNTLGRIVRQTQPETGALYSSVFAAQDSPVDFGSRTSWLLARAGR